MLDPNEVAPEKIEKEFTLVPVEWSGRIYLIYDSELQAFANAVNLGIEPRQTLQSHYDVSPWFGSFYLRKGDQKNQVRGKPGLPKEWLTFLLDRPMRTRVVKVESVKQEKYGTVSVVIIDKGGKDGLKVGMRLIAKKEIPNLSNGTSVISVTRNRAKLEAILNRPVKVGENISSRYEPSLFLKRYWMLQNEDR